MPGTTHSMTRHIPEDLNLQHAFSVRNILPSRTCTLIVWFWLKLQLMSAFSWLEIIAVHL
jgi:hypothetical protein